jgi:hypothetical protein
LEEWSRAGLKATDDDVAVGSDGIAKDGAVKVGFLYRPGVGNRVGEQLEELRGRWW